MLNIHIVHVGKKGSRQETLSSREVFIGRDGECDLVLEDGRVSGLHCRLVAISGGVIVLDEGSTNGTWVNGQRMRQPTLVGLEDTVVVGPYMLSVQSLVAERPLHPRRRGTQVEVDLNKLRAEHRSGQRQ